MGEYGNYGFNHFNDNKKLTNNKINYKPKYKKTSKICHFFSSVLVITIALAIVGATFGFIIFSDNRLGNDIRKKYGLEFKLEKKEDEDVSNYQLVLDNQKKEDEKYNQYNNSEGYYSDNSFVEQQQQIIDSGNIPTKKPTPISNDMDIVSVNNAGDVNVNIVQGDKHPTPTTTICTTPIATPIPEVIEQIVTQQPTINPTSIITPVPAVVTPIVIQPTINPTPIVTPVPEVVTPIIIQPTASPTNPPIVEQETYNINQDAYNNAETIANNYSDITNALLVEINNVRANNNLAALTMDTTLNKMAGYRAYDMGENLYFSHSYNGVSQLRVVMYAYNRLTIRHYENLGKASNVDQSELAKKIVNGWCESNSHYGVMINSNLSIIGIAVHKDYNGTWYIATIYS